MLRRVRSGELVSPHRGLFAERMYWSGLDASQRVLHIIRGLSLLRPTWVFAGPSAAAIHGYEHQWSIHNMGIYIADTVNGASRNASTRINRIYMPSIPMVWVDGVRTTTPERTLLDCGMLLPFRNALPIFDSAFRRDGIESDTVRKLIARLHRSSVPIERLLTYVDPASENGGESLARGTMIEEGFAIPSIQQIIANPQDSSEWYRADFAWSLPNHRLIVAEYDGMAKYIEPSMTSRRSIKAVVNKQNYREQRLRALGVSDIVRFDFDDVIQVAPMASRLLSAGVPLYPRRF